MKTRAVLATLAVAALVACDNPQQPPPPDLAISDGAHGGNSRFFFLPPIVPTPTYGGVFDATLLPSLRVFVTGPYDPILTVDGKPEAPSFASCEPTAPLFHTLTAGLSVSTLNEQYAVGWQTGQAPVPGPQSGKVYRICVRLQPSAAVNVLLGFRDVMPDDGGANQPRNTEQAPVYQFGNGSNVQIKFRVERGVLSAEFCTFGTGGDYDCTAQALGSNETAICDNASCAITTGEVAQRTVFVIERLTCPTVDNDPTKPVNWIAPLDIPQWGGCMRVTVLDGTWSGFINNTVGTLATCFINSPPPLKINQKQDEALQLHIQRAPGDVWSLPNVFSPIDNSCVDPDPEPLASASTAARVAWYLRRAARTAQRVVNPWFAPPSADAFHTGFGGHTTLRTSDPTGSAPSGSAAAALPAGLTLSSHMGENAVVFRLAWALPSEMAKYTFGSTPGVVAPEPIVVTKGDAVTAEVKVTDNGRTANVPVTDRRVEGAVVSFTSATSPLPGQPVRRTSNVQGIAGLQWTLTNGGLNTLTASGYGIGVGGTFAAMNVERQLGTGTLAFQALVCDPADPTQGLTVATVDGVITGGEYANAQQHVVPVNLGGNASSTGTLYIGNDCANLYLAFEVGVSEATNNSIRFLFDNTPPGGESPDDDILSLSKISAGNWLFRDRFLSQACVGSKQADCGPDDTSTGGTKDGMGQATFNSVTGKFVYELSHPLKSGDAQRDFQRSPGQKVGVIMFISLGSGTKGNTEFPDQKGNYKNYLDYMIKGPALTP